MGYTLNKDFFKNDSPESFYIAGFLAADGWLRIIKNKNCNISKYMIGLSLKESDKDHIEKIKLILESNKPLYKRTVKNSKRNPKYKDSITYTLELYSKEIFDDLSKFNLYPRKSLTYQFPEWIKNHEYVKYFLLGYFDGDGSLGFDRKNRKTPQARMHLRGTVGFLQEFHDILYEKCNLKTKNKIISIDSNIGSLQYTGNKNVNSIMSFLYSDPTVFLDRKYKRYEELKFIINVVS